MENADNHPFFVGDWLIESSLNRASRGPEKVSLRPKTIELLRYLAKRHGEVVSIDEILGVLWANKYVTTNSVYNCIAQLRESLGAGMEESAFIQTVARKGYRLVAPVRFQDGVQLSQNRSLGLATVAVVAAGLLLFAAWFYWPQDSSAPTGEIRALVVLPLDNLSADPARDEYFTDGMTEALIARLGQIRDLRVISRTSAMQLKNSRMTIPEIAGLLKVDGVIEGSVLVADRKIRLTLQLIDGMNDSHLWSKSYVRDVDDIIDLQTEVANTIAAELRDRLAGRNQQTTAANVSTTNTEAYTAWLKGRYAFNQFGAENFQAALRHYEQAIELDPAFALAYASLAETCMQPLVLQNAMRTLSDCERDAMLATTMDDSLAEAFAALGYVQLVNWEWQKAERNLQHAIELDPNSAMARQWYTLLLRTAYRFDEALAQIRLAEDIDPLNLFVKTMVGWPLYDLHRYEDALGQWDDVIEMEPDYMLAHYNRGLAYIELRDPARVLAAARTVARIGGDDSVEALLLEASAHAIAGDNRAALDILTMVERESGDFLAAWIAAVYLMMGDEETALARLEHGVGNRSLDMLTISEPKFDPVRNSPRFRALRREMGLPERP